MLARPRVPLVACCLMAQLYTTPAAALVELAESRPGRALVLASGTTDLSGSLGLLLVTTPVTDLGDSALLPLRGAIGIGDRWEGMLAVDLALRPTFAMSLTPRGRFRLDGKGRLAVGVALTLPFGYLWHRLGPEGLPLRFELPVVRLENAQAALQAGANLSYALQEGPDAKSLSLDAAGVVRIGQQGFAILDLGFALPDFGTEEAAVALGLGAGLNLTRRIIAKLQVVTPDLAALDPWQFWLTVGMGLETKEKGVDDWL